MRESGKALALHTKDNVATALATLEAGTTVAVKLTERTEKVRLLSAIPMGHKFALADLAPGQHVIKYGEPIGRATAKIAKGEHVHVHNVAGGKGETK